MGDNKFILIDLNKMYNKNFIFSKYPQYCFKKQRKINYMAHILVTFVRKFYNTQL